MITFLISCNNDLSSPMDQYYYNLDRARCPNEMKQQTQDRLGRKSDLYSMYNLCPKSENSHNYYINLIDSIKTESLNINQIIKKLHPLNWIDSIFIQEAKHMLYTNSDTIIVYPIGKSEIESFGSLSNIDQYLALRHLVANSTKFDYLAKPMEENITIDLLLHLFEKHNLKDKFPGLYITTLQIKGTGFILENEVDNIHYGQLAEIFFTKEIDHIKKHKIFNNHHVAIGNLSESFKKQNDTIKANKTLISVPEHIDSIYIYDLLTFNYLELGYNDLAIECLEVLTEYYGESELYLNQDFARAYAQKGEIEKANFHFNKASILIDFSHSDSIDYLFDLYEVNAIIQKLAFDQSGLLSELQESYELYKKRRTLGEVVFKNDLSHHANEFYVFNTENLLQIAFKIQNIEGQIPNENLFLLKECIMESKQKNEYVDLNGYTRRVNDHTNINDYSNDIFLNHYIDFFDSYNFIENTIDTSLIINAQSKDIPKNNYIKLHFIKGRYHYWCLYEHLEESIIYQIPIQQFEFELKHKFNQLKTNSSLSLPLLDFWEELDLSIEDTVLIYSDGMLNEYPIASNTNNVIYSEYYESNTNYLEADISILSYSNPATNRTLTELEYFELMGGYYEALEISDLYKNNNFKSGSDCTLNNFKSAMSSDILHISTHAYSDSIKRLDSYIILRDSLGQPTRLYADEILTMPTVPKFVNLSACQTGTGVHMAGAGTYSIARSFLQKGSEAVMKTLWDVDDQATKEFMILFYTKWNEGMSCGDALRKTKQDFKSSDKYSAPKFWAGFILEGNPNLYISKN